MTTIYDRIVFPGHWGTQIQYYCNLETPPISQGLSCKRAATPTGTCSTRTRSTTRVLIFDRSGQTAGLRYRYTGPVWPVTGRNRWNSNLNSNFAVQPVRTSIPVGWTSLPPGLAGLPVGLTGNRSNSNFFLFWFKFKCPQSILNKCLYNIF